MGDLKLEEPLHSMAQNSRISADDVLMLRRDFYNNDKIDRSEAEALLALDAAVQDKCREWGQFFSEALVNHIVHQTEPTGEINEDNANWLMACIARQGLIDSAERFEMVVQVLEAAKSSPQKLVRFVLDQVAEAVLNNQGPVAALRAGDQQVICRFDVDLIRRVMFAFGGDGGMAVTRAEAEFLFDLNDKTKQNENDPTWSQLFVKGVANYLLATTGGAVPERRSSLDPFSADTNSSSPVDGLVDMLRSIYKMALSPHKVVEDAFKRDTAVMQDAWRVAEIVTADEAGWVVERIGRDGTFHDNEKALIRFLRDESSNLHPDLRELIAAA